VSPERQADVIIAGGGPAGSVLAWDLARRGIATLVLERARFPREKVCGDYVEPRGLRILREMGCLEGLERTRPLPISRTSIFSDWQCRYTGPIPFYGLVDSLPPHGYVVRREELDAVLLDAASGAGAEVHEETAVSDVDAGPGGVEVSAKRGTKTTRYRARLIVGADGVNSVVARSQGLSTADPRRTVVARRAYAVAEGGLGENAVFFDESLFPGYGWVFPLADGRVNLGVGLLSETRGRVDAQIPALFEKFVEGLGRHYPRCADVELCSRPIGGIVKTYGAAGRNHFDGGLLVGDAGCFVDPMTGEGITPGMESALLAAATLASALEAGQFHAGRLAAYEAAFRRYFDPSMIYLDLCAAALRNRHLARPWLKAFARGCELAQGDAAFTRTGGSFFGGQEILPFDILGQVGARVLDDVVMAWPRHLSGVSDAARRGRGTSPSDLFDWQSALTRSALSDPIWHLRWTLDVQRQWARLLAASPSGAGDPRVGGVLKNSAW
jgi:geranylgeranyl reductase family protein